MMDKSPSEGMTLEELRPEFDWMFEFQSRMAERIRADADVHNLADYVAKIESENAKLQKQSERLFDKTLKVATENAKLRELVRDWYELAVGGADSLVDWNHVQADLESRMRELRIKVDG